MANPPGIDVKEQKMTLPLIHVLNNCTSKEKSWLINSIKNHNKDKKADKEVIAFCSKNNNETLRNLRRKKNGQIPATSVGFNQRLFRTLPYKDSLILMVKLCYRKKEIIFYFF